jgi:hypothetical protein
MKQTLKEYGGTLAAVIAHTGKGCKGYVILKDGLYELWYPNKNHAGYGIKYKNTHLEFSCTIKNYPL